MLSEHTPKTPSGLQEDVEVHYNVNVSAQAQLCGRTWLGAVWAVWVVVATTNQLLGRCQLLVGGQGRV